METLQKIALVFTIIGAINWGLIGLFDFNIVTAIAGDMDTLRNIIYIIIGVTGLINIGIFFSHFAEEKEIIKG
jgi:uncharacterized membrane protein YuzA (DUF378 family)